MAKKLMSVNYLIFVSDTLQLFFILNFAQFWGIFKFYLVHYLLMWYIFNLVPIGWFETEIIL